MLSRRDVLKRAAILGVSLGAAAMAAGNAPEVVLWESHAPVLDQGKVGSCTGNAVTQLLNTDYAIKISGRTAYLAEPDAVKVYTLATDIDSYPGNYPNVDTGSDGSAACEAAVQLGYLSGYQSVAPTLTDLLAALRKQPLIVGSPWLSHMFFTDPAGLVTVSGDVSGGHEYALLGFDTGPSEFTCLNSWSSSWGVNGRFKVKFTDFVNLLTSGDGDTSLVGTVNAPTVKPAT